MMKKYFVKIVAVFFIVCFSVQAIAQNNSRARSDAFNQQQRKMLQMLQMLNYYYVDTIDMSNIVEKGIIEMLKELDPHSVYIAKKDIQKTTEPLQGNFEGVGVQFQIMKDTLVVVQPVKGGPAESVGIQIGDKIITIDDSVAVGKICTNDWVFKKLRGKKGTKVVVQVKRGNNPDLLTFTIIRDKIPINSIESYFMVDDKTGYIKLERFSQTTHTEFLDAMKVLKEQGMENLVLDLRDNGGGYLNTAIEMSDEFLSGDKLIVYTQNNQDYNKINYNAKQEGCFEKGRLVVLINEYSASAAEILSGSIQDWDRGIIIGRRSFGKGLVQSQLGLPDGSYVRLTTSRYYIPSGRCIQKPYEGVEDYSRDVIKRYNSGELIHADSIHFPDSLKFYTDGKRVVYGGGGIMPDIFVPIDTTKVSDYYWQLFRNNIFNQFVFEYLTETNKKQILSQYANFEDFNKNFQVDKQIMSQFYAFAKKEHISDSLKFDMKAYLEGFIEANKDTLGKVFESYAKVKNTDQLKKMFVEYVDKIQADHNQREQDFDTDKYIQRQIKTLIARNIYSARESTKIWLEDDEMYRKALEVINDKNTFKKYKIKY